MRRRDDELTVVARAIVAAAPSTVTDATSRPAEVEVEARQCLRRRGGDGRVRGDLVLTRIGDGDGEVVVVDVVAAVAEVGEVCVAGTRGARRRDAGREPTTRRSRSTRLDDCPRRSLRGTRPRVR